MTSDTLAGRLARLRSRPERVLSPFEFWPDWAMYTPGVLVWLALGLRYRNFTVPTAANPGIETGGLCGESKSEIFALAGPHARTLIPAWTTLTASGDAAADAATAEAAAARAGATFPLVVKPDVGCNGAPGRRRRDGAVRASA